MKKSPYKRRTKKKDKPCPDKNGRKYSMQETGEKDKNGKPIMKCQLDKGDNPRDEERKRPEPTSGEM